MSARALTPRRTATRALLSLLAVGWLFLAGCKCTSGLSPARTDEPTSDADSCVEQYYVDRDHVCARMRDGSYHCRGDNRFLQLTHGVWPGLPPPKDDFRAFPGGWDEIVIGPVMYGTKGGELYVWGDNTHGLITWDAEEHLAEPMPEPLFPSDLLRIAASPGNFWCAVTKKHEVLCRHGQDPVFRVEDAPPSIQLMNVVSAGVCVSSGHGVWCYAHPLLWQEQDTELHPEEFGAPGTHFIPVLGIPEDQRIAEIEWPCARTERGEVWCWGKQRGRNLKGKAGPCLDCPPEHFRTATRADLPLAKDLDRAAILDQEGYVWAWAGGPFLEEFGARGQLERPVRLDVTGTDNEWLSYNIHSYCVRKTNGTLMCLGKNYFGQFTGPNCARGKICGPTVVEFACR